MFETYLFIFMLKLQFHFNIFNNNNIISQKFSNCFINLNTNIFTKSV